MNFLKNLRCKLWSISAALLIIATLFPLPVSAVDGGLIQNIFLQYVLQPMLSTGVWITVGTLALTVAGFTLLTSQDEGALTKARGAIFAVIMGGIIIVVIRTLDIQFLQFFIDIGSYNTNTVTGTGASDLSKELGLSSESGIAGWLATIGGVLGILMVIVSVAIAMASIGDEDAYGKAKTSILTSIFGVLIILAGSAISNTVYVDGTPNDLMLFILGKLNIILAFISIIAVALLVYAGIRLIVSLGDEEAYTQAKGLLLRIVLGIIVIVISYTLVYTVVQIYN